VPPHTWAPSIDDVGATLRARTIDNNGSEVGTFTSSTRPTNRQVEDLIAQACADVVDACGHTIPNDLQDSASYAASIGAACLVEISYYPEQVGSGRSPYPELKSMYDERLLRLIDSVAHEGMDVPGNEYMVPAGAFGGPALPIGWFTTPW
jgi:hypothetical protein